VHSNFRGCVRFFGGCKKQISYICLNSLGPNIIRKAKFISPIQINYPNSRFFQISLVSIYLYYGVVMIHVHLLSYPKSVAAAAPTYLIFFHSTCISLTLISHNQFFFEGRSCKLQVRYCIGMLPFSRVFYNMIYVSSMLFLSFYNF
jgi:hypothetical protein